MLTVEKTKPPKGRSYVLKTSMLESILEERGIEAAIHLIYWTPQKGSSIFESHYWLPNENISNRRVYIRAGSLLREDKFIAQEELGRTVLPIFSDWLMYLNTLPSNSPILFKAPYFNASYVDRKLKIHVNPKNE